MGILNPPPMRRLAVAALLALAAACGADLRNGTLTIPIVLREASINRLLLGHRTAVVLHDGADSITGRQKSASLLDSLTQVDFREPNVVRAHGIRNTPDGPRSGSFDVSFAVSDRQLVVAVTDVQIPGLTIDSPEVAHINAELQREFEQAATADQAGRHPGVTMARVRDRALELTLEVPLR